MHIQTLIMPKKKKLLSPLKTEGHWAAILYGVCLVCMIYKEENILLWQQCTDDKFRESELSMTLYMLHRYRVFLIM